MRTGKNPPFSKKCHRTQLGCSFIFILLSVALFVILKPLRFALRSLNLQACLQIRLKRGLFLLADFLPNPFVSVLRENRLDDFCFWHFEFARGSA